MIFAVIYAVAFPVENRKRLLLSIYPLYTTVQGAVHSNSNSYPLYIRGELQQSRGSCDSESLCPSDWRVQTDIGHCTALQNNTVILEGKDNTNTQKLFVITLIHNHNCITVITSSLFSTRGLLSSFQTLFEGYICFIPVLLSTSQSNWRVLVKIYKNE